MSRLGRFLTNIDSRNTPRSGIKYFYIHVEVENAHGGEGKRTRAPQEHFNRTELLRTS